jgi:hypothetical protein
VWTHVLKKIHFLFGTGTSLTRKVRWEPQSGAGQSRKQEIILTENLLFGLFEYMM